MKGSLIRYLLSFDPTPAPIIYMMVNGLYAYVLQNKSKLELVGLILRYLLSFDPIPEPLIYMMVNGLYAIVVNVMLFL